MPVGLSCQNGSSAIVNSRAPVWVTTPVSSWTAAWTTAVIGVSSAAASAALAVLPRRILATLILRITSYSALARLSISAVISSWILRRLYDDAFLALATLSLTAFFSALAIAWRSLEIAFSCSVIVWLSLVLKPLARACSRCWRFVPANVSSRSPFTKAFIVLLSTTTILLAWAKSLASISVRILATSLVLIKAFKLSTGLLAAMFSCPKSKSKSSSATTFWLPPLVRLMPLASSFCRANLAAVPCGIVRPLRKSVASILPTIKSPRPA